MDPFDEFYNVKSTSPPFYQPVFSHAEKLKTEKDNGRKVKYLLEGFGEILPNVGHSQNPILLASILKMIGNDEFYLQAYIETPDGVENKLPGRIIPFADKGNNKKNIEYKYAKIQMLDTLQIFNLFYE